MRRGSAFLATVTLLGMLASGCATHEGSQAKFCAALPKTGDLMSILNDFSSTDPAQLSRRFSTGLAQYRQLERDAPREIRGDVATLADAVEQILAVVQRHPDDLSAIRNELTGSRSVLVSAGKSALSVSNYAQAKCGININGPALDPAGRTTTTTG